MIQILQSCNSKSCSTNYPVAAETPSVQRTPQPIINSFPYQLHLALGSPPLLLSQPTPTYSASYYPPTNTNTMWPSVQQSLPLSDDLSRIVAALSKLVEWVRMQKLLHGAQYGSDEHIRFLLEQAASIASV